MSVRTRAMLQLWTLLSLLDRTKKGQETMGMGQPHHATTPMKILEYSTYGAGRPGSRGVHVRVQVPCSFRDKDMYL